MSTLPAAVPARGAVVARSVLLRGSWSAVALCFGTATAAVTAMIGPDARWLGALGRVVAVGIALLVTRREMRRLGATDAGAALALALLVPGALLAFAGIRAQLFSLSLLPVVFALLRREAAAPSRRGWFVSPP